MSFGSQYGGKGSRKLMKGVLGYLPTRQSQVFCDECDEEHKKHKLTTTRAWKVLHVFISTIVAYKGKITKDKGLHD